MLRPILGPGAPADATRLPLSRVRVSWKIWLGEPNLTQLEDRTRHQVRKRYSDFDSFRRKLQKQEAGAPPFPPKKMFGNLAPEFVEERRQGLEAWVSWVAAQPQLLCGDECADFFGVP